MQAEIEFLHLAHILSLGKQPHTSGSCALVSFDN